MHATIWTIWKNSQSLVSKTAQQIIQTALLPKGLGSMVHSMRQQMSLESLIRKDSTLTMYHMFLRVMCVYSSSVPELVLQ